MPNVSAKFAMGFLCCFPCGKKKGVEYQKEPRIVVAQPVYIEACTSSPTDALALAIQSPHTEALTNLLKSEIKVTDAHLSAALKSDNADVAIQLSEAYATQRKNQHKWEAAMFLHYKGKVDTKILASIRWHDLPALRSILQKFKFDRGKYEEAIVYASDIEATDLVICLAEHAKKAIK